MEVVHFFKKQMEREKFYWRQKSFAEDKLILPYNGKCGGDWRSVGFGGVRSLSEVNMCEKSPVSTIYVIYGIDPAATTLSVDTWIFIYNKLILYSTVLLYYGALN